VSPSDDVDEDLVEAILEGRPIDWAPADPGSEPPRPLISQLKVVAAIAAFARSDHAAAPLLWGHLQLVERIGRGAFGEVYRAWDTRLDREVALKLLPADGSAGDRTASAIIHEGRLLARVRHPNVVTIYGAEQISGRIGLWMELVRGQTLEQILDERKVVSTTEAIDIGLELCRAISAVHGAGLLHRDIKTHNVMRAEDDRILLMDFGTGRELDDDTSSDLAGTPLYLAPEVLNGRPATVQSDIYSLGVLLYHLVTGSYPVHAQTVRDVRRAHERGDRIAVRTARSGVPRKIARVIERAIDRNPARRYQSAEALGADLRALKPRRTTARLAYAAGLAAASVLFATVAWELISSTQDEISRAIANRLGLTISERQRRPLHDLDAYERYLQARTLVDRRGIPNALKAAELFKRVIAVDPGFAPAHAGLANAYAFASFPFRGIEFEAAYPIMRRAALEALRLDPLLAEAHMAMGWVYAYEHDWMDAERSFQRSIQLDPSLTQAYTSYSISTLQPLERYDEALRLLQEALRHDPLSLDVQREIGEVQLYSGRYAEAVETFQRAVQIDPDFPFVRSFLARALILTDRVDEALQVADPGLPFVGLGQAYVLTGRRAEAEKLAAEWERYPFRLAITSAALGDAERAVEALERAAVSEPHRMGRLLNEPELAALRGDPRVTAIRRKFGLPYTAARPRS
jgi:tetratricopeptide (TPR) repeat protein